MAIPQLTSRIDTVKVYSAGATVTRIADLNLNSGELPEQVEISGLPLALDDSSVRVRVEVEQGNPPIAGDVRIGLAVPPPPEVPNPPAEEEIRKASAEVQRIQDLITLIENEIAVLSQLNVPDRPKGEPGKAPPPSPMSARLALANFSDEQIRARLQEKRNTEEQLRLAQEHLEDLQQKQARASTARDVRPNELRKTVIISLSSEGAESPRPSLQSRLIVEYFVPGARWTPTYVCRLNSAESTANIAVRALICQHTGEDWSAVRLELSTAEPMAWCALPELPSLRLGKAQPLLRKSGWRRPPIGAELLFEDYDRQKHEAISAVDFLPTITDFSSPYVPPLPHIAISLWSNEDERIGAAYDVLENIGAPAPSAEIYDQAPPSLDDVLLDDVWADFANLEGLPQANMPSMSRVPASPPARAGKRSGMVRFREEAGATLSPPSPGGTAEESSADLLTYNLMRMGSADDPGKRGKLSIEQRQEFYLEILKRQEVVVNFDVLQVIQQAVTNAENSVSVPLPPGGIHVRQIAGAFDYAYNADGRVDVPSDSQFHSVALTSNSTDVDLRYIVVPREDTNVFRIAQLRNPLPAPLLSGPADVYVDGEYILSTNIATVPPRGQMELGLGVEQAIKVARNTFYEELRSGETVVAFNELRHKIKIEITNQLSRSARIEVRERIPIPQAGAKVDIQVDQVSPSWEKYEQQERSKPIKGGYCWRVEIPSKEQQTLSVQYTIKTFVDSEIMGGNRREA